MTTGLVGLDGQPVGAPRTPSAAQLLEAQVGAARMTVAPQLLAGLLADPSWNYEDNPHEAARAAVAHTDSLLFELTRPGTVELGNGDRVPVGLRGRVLDDDEQAI